MPHTIESLRQRTRREILIEDVKVLGPHPDERDRERRWSVYWKGGLLRRFKQPNEANAFADMIRCNIEELITEIEKQGVHYNAMG